MPESSDTLSLIARIDERTGMILGHMEEIDRKYEMISQRQGEIEGRINKYAGGLTVLLFILTFLPPFLSNVLKTTPVAP